MSAGGSGGPPDPAVARARRRAVSLLEAGPEPMPGRVLAGEILGLRGGTNAACDALLRALLEDDPRFEYIGEAGWRLCESAAAYAPSAPPSTWTWAVFAAEPRLTAAAVVRLEGGAVIEERFEPADLETHDHEPAELSHSGQRDRAALRRPHEKRRGSGDAGRAENALPRLGEDVLGRLAALSRGAHWASSDPAAVFDLFRSGLGPTDAASGAPDREQVVHLPRLTLAVWGPPRPRTIGDIAGRLGIQTVAGEHPLARARLAAECLLRLLEHPALSHARELEEILAAQRSRPAPVDLAGKNFDARFLSELSGESGTYRFFDREGALLYVGKARNLRARVGSYFASRRTADTRTAAWLGDVHRIEVESSDSELEALLREADLIARTSPLRNTQRMIHDRPGKKAANLVLLLPANRGAAVRAHVIHDGEIVARILLGPRRGGVRALRSALETYFFRAARTHGIDSDRALQAPEFSPPGHPPSRSSPAASPASSGGRPANRGRGGGAREARRARARALVASWLGRQTGTVSTFDPTDAAGPDEALDLALRYAESIRGGERDVIHR